MKRICVLAFALTVLLAMPLLSQTRSTNRGFVLGAHLAGVSLDPEDAETDDGGGFGITAAYGFRSGLSIFLSGTVAHMRASDDAARDYVLGEGDLGVRYTFGSTSARWRPFVAAAVSGVTVSFENVEFGDFGRADVEVSGPAFTAGGGVQLFVSPRWALDGALLWSAGNFDEVKIDNVTVELDENDKINLTTSRLQLGVRYYFSGGKQ